MPANCVIDELNSPPRASGADASLLTAKDYILLADVEEHILHSATVAAYSKDTGATTMTSHFPAPWRIVEIPNGFAVDDATGRQLAVFYGRVDSNIAGHTGFLTIDEARQLADNFAKLPDLLKLASTPSSFAKTTPQQPRARAPKQNGRHAPTQLKRLRTNLALPAKIVTEDSPI